MASLAAEDLASPCAIVSAVAPVKIVLQARILKVPRLEPLEVPARS